MLYFTYGTDKDKVRIRHKDIINKLLAKKPDATLVSFNDENLTETALEECLGGQGLFESRFIVEIDRVISDMEQKNILYKWAGEISDSKNIFVWREEKVDIKTLRLVEEKATKVQKFGDTVKVSYFDKKNGFSIFDLGNALGKKDKKSLWVLFQKSRIHNSSPEEVHGMLHWQVRTILAVLSFPKSSALQLGMKSNVYNNANSYARNYTKSEIRGVSKKLLEIYYDSRAGGDVLDIALEKFILSL